jgi:hypothetical protein
MFSRRKIKKNEVDEQLLEKIRQYRFRWKHLKELLENSIEPSENTLNDLAVAKAKYFFLLKEARNRKLKEKF